ncbi:MAG: cobalamin-dependent protein [Planctomycetota bacterium]
MRVLLINPPYQTITSTVGVGPQIPLGLLMVGGSLLDSGHQVQFLDAESRRLSIARVVQEVLAARPEVVMTGHAGSTPAHPITMKTLQAIKLAAPEVKTVYGGVYPTYQADKILRTQPAVDIIVRGEGEETSRRLLAALASPPCDLTALPGLAFREEQGGVRMTAPAAPIRLLDRYRIGWELVDDWDRYRCFGLGRAAIVQFSRGCPHRCTYCGQFDFWKRWRHRDPVVLADEIEWLHRQHDIRFITLADENPAAARDVWQTFLEELAGRRLPVHFFASIRATDIVRDADLLELYRRAGILYVLMGIETTKAAVIQAINKRSSIAADYRACQLLKLHGIFSIIGHVVGFEDDTWTELRAAGRTLARYNGDHLNAMYATPHPWTLFGREVAARRICEHDLSRWDYRHQVLAQNGLRRWQLFLAVKWLEFRFHLRLPRLWAILRERNAFRRHQLAWCLLHTGQVFLAELADLARSSFRHRPPVSVNEFYSTDGDEVTRPASCRRLASRRPCLPPFLPALITAFWGLLARTRVGTRSRR